MGKYLVLEPKKLLKSPETDNLRHIPGTKVNGPFGSIPLHWFPRLHQERTQPERFSRLMNGAASGQFLAIILGPSHSIFWPARKDTQPSSMISVRREVISKRE